MKFTTKALVLAAGALLIAAPGCGSKDNGSTGGTPTTSAGDTSTAPAAPASTPAAPAPAPPTADISKKPATTKINGKTVTLKSTPSGLQYYDIKVGTGPSPDSGQTAAVQYTGALPDGTKFDSSYDHGTDPFEFPVGMGRVIKGWDEGVATMKVGGKRRLVVPADLAYGPDSPTPAIPPNSTLVFDVELIAVK